MCYLGAGPNRTSVVILPNINAGGLRLRARLLNSSATNPGPLVLAHLVINGFRHSSGVYGGDVLLEDVTVQNCDALPPSPPSLQDFAGAGLNVGSVTAANCAFISNRAYGQGGAIYVRAGGTASLQQVTVMVKGGDISVNENHDLPPPDIS